MGDEVIELLKSSNKGSDRILDSNNNKKIKNKDKKMLFY